MFVSLVPWWVPPAIGLGFIVLIVLIAVGMTIYDELKRKRGR